MAIIFAISSIPDLGTVPGGVSDKSGHFIGYALLGALVLRALAGGRLAGVTLRRALLAVAFAAAYGITDEWHQSFVPGRSPDPLDVVADTLGAAVAVLLVGVLAAGKAWGILGFSSPRDDADERGKVRK
jgi:VanZ family protein